MIYTTTDFLHAIQREQAKRATTYPKLLAKMVKEGATAKRTANAISKQNLQNGRLLTVYNVLRDSIDYMDAQSAYWLLQELQREMKMRESVYKRFVMLKRITPEAAEEQLSVWRALCKHWEEKYITGPSPAG